MKITHTKITASSSTDPKLWMAVYWTPEKEKKKVYFEASGTFDQVEKKFKDWIPEPFIKALLRGSAPSQKTLEDEGDWEFVNIEAAQKPIPKLPGNFSEWVEYAHGVKRDELDPAKIDDYLHEYRQFLKDKQRMRNTGVYSAEDSELANSRKDRKRSPANVRYKGYFIVLDRGGDGYNVYNEEHELEEEGIDSLTKAKEFVDNLRTKSPIHGAEETVDEDELEQLDQEFTSKETSINKAKLPAIYNLVNFPKGSLVIDYGGGKWDNGPQYLETLDCTGLVYDPYNRTSEHNRAVVRECRENGGADIGLCSNVLNVIKEPEVRKQVLTNMSKLVKNGGDIYITVYEGSGSGEGKQSQSDSYQLNRKTKDYLEEIQEVFPDATRKGKLIKATNTGAVTSNEAIMCNTDGLEEVKDMFEDGYQGSGWMEEEIQLDQGDGNRLKKYLEDLGYKVKKNLKEKIWILPGECFWTDTVFYPYRPDPQLQVQMVAAARHLNKNRTAPYQVRADMKELQDDLYNAAAELLTSEEFGFPMDEIADYLVIEVTPIYEIPEDETSKIYGYKAEVRAELTYDGMDELVQHLNPIVELRDEDAYFDHVTGGIIDAYMYFPSYYKDNGIYNNTSITGAVSKSDINHTMMRAVDIKNRAELNAVLTDLLSIDEDLYRHFCDLDQSEEYSPAALGKMISNELYWKLEDEADITSCDTIEAAEDNTSISDLVKQLRGRLMVLNNAVEYGGEDPERIAEEREKILDKLDKLGVDYQEVMASQEAQSYKVRFYIQDGANKGNLDHEEFFDTKEDALKAYRKVFDRNLYSLNPTVWVAEDGDWRRLMGDELVNASETVESAAKVEEDGWTREYNSELEREEYTLHTNEGSAFIRSFDYDGDWGYNAAVTPKGGHRTSKTFHLKGSLEDAKKYCEDRLYKKDVDSSQSIEAGKLVDAPQEVVDELLEILGRYGFVLDSRFSDNPGRTLIMGDIHLQVINPDSFIDTSSPNNISNLLREYVSRDMIIEIHDLEKRSNCPITWNFGVDDNQQVTGGLDIMKKYVDDTIEGAYYGGAYDIEDDQYFTKEDLVEVGEEIAEEFSNWCNEVWNLDSTFYGDGGPNLYEVHITDDDIWLDAGVKVDMRKIRRPRDLAKYKDELLRQLKESYREYHDEEAPVESSEKITAKATINWDDPIHVSNTYELEFDAIVHVEDQLISFTEDSHFNQIDDDEYGIIPVATDDDIAEYLIDLVEVNVPEEDGDYRVSGIAHLTFDLDNIYQMTTDPEYDDITPNWDYYLEYMEKEFDPRGSYIENLQVEKV